MKNRMRIFALIAILTIAVGTLTACGDIEETSGSLTIDEIIDEGKPATKDEAVVEEDTTIVEDEAVVEDEEVVEDETVDEAEPAQTDAPKTDTGGSKTNDSTNSGSKTNGSTTNKPADPTHTHNWKEHTVTEQVWVPNIVVVDDYEERVVGHVDDVFICNCGYTTTNRDDIANHVKSNVLAGNEGHGNFTIQPGYDVVEVVKVGSHEEDHGHNETKTYVDYYYCDCGERK